jgi:hypothetical protein
MTTSLAEIQKTMAEGLLHHKNDGIKQFLSDGQEDLDARISVYRNNVFYSLSNALADLYPVVQELVGQEFFRALANRYVRMYPPAQAAMVYFGEEFPDFVEQDKACAELLYLPDVAKLELARQRAYHAADIESLTPEAMQEVGVDRLLQSCLTLHPSVQLLSSSWAVRSIWLAHKGDQPKFEDIDLFQGQQSILVRPAYEVLVCAVDLAAMALFAEIAKGAALGAAIETAFEQYPELDVTQALALGFSNGFFTDINFQQE